MIENQRSNKGLIIILVLIILVLLGIVGYLGYDKYFNRVNDKTNDVVEEKHIEKDLDINSSKVLNLYRLVNYDDSAMKWEKDLADKEVVSVDQLDYYDKFLFAANLSKKGTLDCNSLTDEIASNYNLTDAIRCDGTVYNEDTNQWEKSGYSKPLINSYLEDDIKSSMYNIFGKDYYTRKDIIGGLALSYMYSNVFNSYIIVDDVGSAVRDNYESKLLSAKEIDDTIILYEEAIGVNYRKKMNVKYTFKYNENDDSYYFYSIEKEMVK